ncbi:MAG: nitroreductase [Pseudomonadota bacterium]
MSEITPAQAFLLTRRSRPYKLLGKPVPSRGEVGTMITAACRTPDHGKLEPWRFVVLEEAALRRLAPIARARAEALGQDADKAAHQYEVSPFAIVVVESPVASDKIPAIEQTYSAGAVCLALLNAALSVGWGANWLSGVASHDADFRAEMGLEPQERIAGLIHIGTASQVPPDRPRPNINVKTTWVAS